MHQLDPIDTYGIFYSTIAESYSLKTCLYMGKRNFVLMRFLNVRWNGNVLERHKIPFFPQEKHK